MRERFNRVIETKKCMHESIEAGREYAEAYVQFVHYIEAIHNIVLGETIHHIH